jgi:glycosyltransferase involved in cell wall biosynthesis
MKVAVVTQYFPTSTQPWAGHSAYQTLHDLAQLCDLRVFYPEVTYPRPLAPRTHAAGGPNGSLDRTWNPPGVAVTYIPYPALPILTRPLNGFTMARWLLPHVRAFKPDVILNYVVYPDGYAAVRIGHALNVPVVLTAIGSDLNRIPDPLCGTFTRTALRRASIVTTVSADLARTAVRLGAEPTRTQAILNGCDTAVFYPRDRAAARQSLSLSHTAEIVLYVGRLDIRKGLIELIESIASLRPSHPSVHCYLVGSGTDQPLLLRAIAKHNVANAITLIPSCPTEQVALWMAAADLVTLPSYKEGCPNVVIEALGSGRPVVATHVGGIPELMDSTCGRLVPSQNVPALTQALAETLAQPWDPTTIAAKHTRPWSKVAADLYQVLEQRTTEQHMTTS